MLQTTILQSEVATVALLILAGCGDFKGTGPNQSQNGFEYTGGAADVEQLSLATGQAPAYATYDALDVPSQSAGWSYTDPTTGVRVYKVSDSSTDGGSNVLPAYAEGGPHISLPWQNGRGETMYTLYLLGSFDWLVDFNYDTGVFSNWRTAPGGELEIGFSYNPSEPTVMYYLGGGGVQRYDTRTDQIDNTGNFPGPDIGDMWFHLDVNDEWFVAEPPPEEPEGAQAMKTYVRDRLITSRHFQAHHVFIEDEVSERIISTQRGNPRYLLVTVKINANALNDKAKR